MTTTALQRLREGLNRARLVSKIAIQVNLTRIGAHCSPVLIHQLKAAVRYLETGRWMNERGFSVPSRYARGHQLWEAVAPEVADAKILYLEFGVWRGYSIRAWAKLLQNPDSMLHGFDSFEGLPTDWPGPKMRAGHFSTGGRVPIVDDPRIRFYKGWFHETLPTYEWPSGYDRLIVNFDADLYASTAYVLDAIADRIVPGTLLYFDEFLDHDHERRAFAEFLDKTHMTFRLRAAKCELSAVMFERVD